MFQAQMQTALNLLYPPACISCRAPVSTDFGLCGTCLKETPFVTGGVCGVCGVPVAGVPQGETDICEDCLTLDRPWQNGRTVMTYEGRGRSLVLRLKHGDRTDLARPAGAWMARAARPLVQHNTILVPVPMHRFRLLRRTYNQAALLAHVVARHLQRPCVPDFLCRTRATPGQDRRGRDSRFANLDGAIGLGRRSLERFGQNTPHILLVDDVMTSGATLAACASACRDAGFPAVDVLTLARVRQEEFASWSPRDPDHTLEKTLSD